MAVKVTEGTLKGLNALMNSGTTTLNDLPAAIKQLEEMGQYEASDWVQDNWEMYEKGLREGFEAE